LKKQEFLSGGNNKSLTVEAKAHSKKFLHRRGARAKIASSKMSPGAARVDTSKTTELRFEIEEEELDCITDESFEISVAPTFERLRYSINQRVLVWSESAEAGLRYYKFGESGDETLSREEMILRHSFPLDLLDFAIHEDFSRKGEWRSETSIHEHWDALISIDGKKYILEVTMNERGEVYHFYARPRMYVEDNEMFIRSISEFPDLAKSSDVSRLTALPKRGEISEDEKGNVTFIDNVSGVCYKILRLSGF
jgi:hypothetical protein